MGMINLNENPQAVLDMRDGEIVLVDDHQFKFEVHEETTWSEERVFLTAQDPVAIVGQQAFSDPDGEYRYYEWVHLRMSNNALGGAAMARSEMVDILQNKQYKLS